MFKFIEPNSLRIRMISGFLFLTLLILILAIVSIFIIDRTTKIARVHGDISQLEIFTLNMIKSDNDFFDQETINDNYFKTHRSAFLEIHDSLNNRVVSGIKELFREDTADKYGVKKSLEEIDSLLSIYNLKFKALERLVFQKGFRDYGIEGKMRYHAHALEAIMQRIDIVSILSLRRHEKDFLLRNDLVYAEEFKALAENLTEDMQKSGNHQAAFHLLEYKNKFKELVSIQQQLGLTSKDGLRNELNNLTAHLGNGYYALAQYSYAHAESAYSRLRIFYLSLFVGAILFSILSGYWISKRLSAPVASLSKIIQDALNRGTTDKTDFRIPNAAIEIAMLSNAFVLLIEQVKTQGRKSKTKSVQLRQKNKELKKVNRELDNFLYSTAHDLRSPLSSLLGLTNIMRHENKQQHLVEYMDQMEKSIRRSENFISQIVSYSKNKRTAIHPEKIELQSLISGIIEDHQFIEGSSRIEKFITIEGDTELFSDRSRLAIIFNNLISNAIKYADFDKDSPFFRVYAKIGTQELTVDFSDNGIGIDQEHLGNIFKMFYRAHNTSSGSGLGLFIFKESINSMNGRASVESQPGVGTRFIIQLPNLFQLVDSHQLKNSSRSEEKILSQ